MLSAPVAADDARLTPGAPAGARADEHAPSKRLFLLVPGLSAVLLATGFLPWIASGRATYSSFTLAAVSRRTGLLDGAAAALPIVWLLVPLLVAAVVAASVLRLDRVANGLAAALAISALVVVGATALAAGAAGLGVLFGVYLALAAALLLGGVLLLGAIGALSLVRARPAPPGQPQ